ncbi:MAG: Wzz/FepE/Etk N-terminal domain-containing protein, partial [Gemmatimonadota bacterium]
MDRPEEQGGRLPSARGFSGQLAPRETPVAYYDPGPEPNEAPGLSLGAIAGMLWRRKWTIVLSTIALVAVATFLTLRMPQTFESTVTVLVEEGDARNEGSALEVLEGIGTTETPLETETRLITSRRVIEPVVSGLAMHVAVEGGNGRMLRPQEVFTGIAATSETVAGEYRVNTDGRGGYTVVDAVTDTVVARAPADSGNATVEFAGLGLEIAPDDPGVGNVLHVSSFLNTVAGVRQRISASPVGQEANLIEIRCVATQAAAAERLCQAVSVSYLRLKSEVQRAEADVAAEFLGEQVEVVNDRLRAAEDSLGAYEEEN